MKQVGSLNKAEIGKFRDMNSVRLNKRIQAVKTEVEEVRDQFRSFDGSKKDYNDEKGPVLLDRVAWAKNPRFHNSFEIGLTPNGSYSGFLDDKAGELKAEQTSSNSYSLGGRGGTSHYGKEYVRTENESETRWRVTDSSNLTGDASVRTREVVEDKQSGTLTLLEG
ncbi:MAG: hypothetical protein KC800_12700 [Candidatus Eremiobacteraeota bacterium]|nr:hypothetical protein [Candidatus Eremiobacteraeota bacterium]